MSVHLVGAGPGDPGLVTVRATELLGRCDVVVYDRLAPSALLDLVRHDAEKIDVGKRPSISEIDQAAINALIVEAAGQGKMVVRLKGGDPFVFGRGGEEAQALAAAGIPFEVVPGVSAAIAVPAYAGVPLTHRGVSESVTIVTGHGEKGASRVDWEALARLAGTIVVLMGVTHRVEIARRLIDGGLDPATPVAAIRWGTRPDQVTVRTTLAGLAGEATPSSTSPIESLRPPATIVIGEVAALNLSWFESKPLFGWKVVVTRARTQASELAAKLADCGAGVVEMPVIEIADPTDGGAGLASALDRVGDYEWMVLTSPNGARRVVDTLRAAGRDARALGGVLVAAVGPGTAAVLAQAGIVADLVPDSFVAEALLASFPSPSEQGGPRGTLRRVLIARAAIARDVIPKGLKEMGWQVDIVEAYSTVRAKPDAGVLEAVGGADAVTFASASSVDAFVEIAGPSVVPDVVVCIGPVTADAALAHGIRVDAVAAEHTIDGLVEALLAVVRSRSMAPA